MSNSELCVELSVDTTPFLTDEPVYRSWTNSTWLSSLSRNSAKPLAGRKKDSSSSLFLLGRPEPRSGRAYTLPVMFFFRHAFSETPHPIALKLCHVIRIWLYFINWLQKFEGCSPKKIWGQKHAKFRSILDHFRLWSRISPEQGNISEIGKTYELAKFLLRLTK